MTITMLAKQLEKVLPEGQIIVAVGGGDHCLTEQGKEWLASIAGVSAKCGCSCCDCDEDGDYESGYDDGYAKGYSEGRKNGYSEGRRNGYDDGYEDGNSEGYSEGYADAKTEDEECDDAEIDYEEYYDAMQRIIAIIDDIETID
jgi:hypothetical protein